MADTPQHQMSDGTETERRVVQTTRRERHGRDIELQLANADVRISPADRDLTACPVVVRQSDDGCAFARCKVVDSNHRRDFLISRTSRSALVGRNTTTSPSVRSRCFRPGPHMPPESTAICRHTDSTGL
ncbi:MAG: hypothetical protein WBG92_10205 [Thiohalocapsa sp.]